MRTWVRRAGPALALWLGGCAVVDFARPGATDAETTYAGTFAYYAEFCALSQIRKKPGFGAEVVGEIGGHAVFYLNGACRGTGPDRQVLRLCDGTGEAGVGISMNEHFRNAKWVAIPGRDIFFDGGLPPAAPLTRAAYRRTQDEARRLGLYDGIDFHPRFFAAMPAGADAEAYKYEISVATDYAISHGRGRYCARVPVTEPQMRAMIGFLNAENAPYRSGAREFRWSLFRDNCIHLAHNALAAAGFWQEWPTNRSLLVSILDFPVPKNEFVNLMRRANDPALADPIAVWRDPRRGGRCWSSASCRRGPGPSPCPGPPASPMPSMKRRSSWSSTTSRISDPIAAGWRRSSPTPPRSSWRRTSVTTRGSPAPSRPAGSRCPGGWRNPGCGRPRPPRSPASATATPRPSAGMSPPWTGS
ncbi:hypothetical protein ACFQY5_25715 [Paeniroseomonas aquatica]|uniref:hypothetical protein n=1 Tax=Paeniroseomonas aquatica TaxID=373043 RepID=UPI00361CF7B2